MIHRHFGGRDGARPSIFDVGPPFVLEGHAPLHSNQTFGGPRAVVAASNCKKPGKLQGGFFPSQGAGMVRKVLPRRRQAPGGPSQRPCGTNSPVNEFGFLKKKKFSNGSCKMLARMAGRNYN